MPSKLLHGAKKWDGIPCIQEKEEIMDLPALHSRHRDRNGELSKKHGNTLVRTLRKIYGRHFAEGCSPEETLNEVLQKLDEPSLSRLVHEHEHHRLYQLIEQAPER
jgi:hypothetical protein